LASLTRRATGRGRRAPAADRKVGLEEIVALLGIGHLLRRRPGGLSGGEKQRVAIGRALLANPALLLLDEPLAALDAARKQEILPFIERLRDELSRPIVYVSHDAGEILRLADRVVLLDQGAAVAAGPVAEVFSRPELQRLVGEAEAGAVIEARVEGHDERFALTYLEFTGGRLAVPRLAAEPGSDLRLRIRARDISIARARPAEISILNIIEARIRGLQPADGANVDVELAAGVPPAEVPLWARITARSAHDLALAPGQAVFAGGPLANGTRDARLIVIRKAGASAKPSGTS